jgi:hypothetical protein
MAAKPKLANLPDDNEREESLSDQWESAQEVKEEKQSFLWPGRLPAGVISIIEGEKGVGKSSLAAAIVAALTGKFILPGKRKRFVGSVLWLCGEESVETDCKPRLRQLGADMKRVHFPTKNSAGVRRRPLLPGATALLDESIRHFGARLLIIDPVSSFVHPDVDLRVDQAIHEVLDPVADVARATGCAILLTRNLTKNTSASRLDRGLGGAGLAGVARLVQVIDWPDRSKKRRVLRQVVSNLGGKVLPLEYSFGEEEGEPLMHSFREIPASADDPDADLLDAGERDTRADARALLRKIIGEQWVNAKDIVKEAQGAAIGERTLRSAKADMNVRSRRKGRANPPYWEWGPPLEGWPN